MTIYVVPPYRYAAPLIRSLRDAGITILTALPPDAYSMIRRGEADAGLVPIRMLIDGELMPVPGPMVYSHDETMSVLVVSHERLNLHECRSVVASPESRSAITYLLIAIRKLGLEVKFMVGSSPRASDLLSIAPCALVLGDEALRARRFFNIVIDVGALVKNSLGISPVYAATGALPSKAESISLDHIEPRFDPYDAIETARVTGLSIEESRRYHESIIKLKYDERLLSTAMNLLSDGIAIHGLTRN
ncbi:MAG: hypothetical protein RXQ96_07785 [Thermocladium sp.]|nr:MAG: hypothetical protein AT710_05355 [Thermocladium sp. ECH_B]